MVCVYTKHTICIVNSPTVAPLSILPQPQLDYKFEMDSVDRIVIPPYQYTNHTTRRSGKQNDQFHKIRHSSNTFVNSYIPLNIITCNSLHTFKHCLFQHKIMRFANKHDCNHIRKYLKNHIYEILCEKMTNNSCICDSKKKNQSEPNILYYTHNYIHKRTHTYCNTI